MIVAAIETRSGVMRMPYMQLMEERIHFLGITQDIIDQLKDAREIIEPSIDRILDGFYDRLLEVAELKQMFDGPEAITRARNAQKRHWLDALFSGKYDDAYYQRTAQIGRAHARIGLTPNWYIGGYNLMLSEFIGQIETECADDPQRASKMIEAVSKIVFLDMDLVMHCYLEAKDESMRRLLLKSSEFRKDMWAIVDSLNNRADTLVEVVEGYRKDPNGDGRDQAAKDQILGQVALVKSEARELEERMRKLPLSEKLYLPNDGLLTRLWARLTGIGI